MIVTSDTCIEKFSRSIIEDSRSVIDNYKWCSKLWRNSMNTLEVSFMIIFLEYRPLIHRILGDKQLFPITEFLNWFFDYIKLD